MRRIILSVAAACVLNGTALADFNFSLGGTDAQTIRMEVWTSEKGGVSFQYPSDWGPAKAREDGGVQLYSAGRGWFQVSLVELPAGETLEGFSSHLIEKSKEADWDLQLKDDKGPQIIGGKRAWVHVYRHKSKNRIYYGYHFVPDQGNIGIRVLVVNISPKGKPVIMEMLRSLSYPGSGKVVKDRMEEPVAEETAPSALGVYQESGNVGGRVRLKNLRDKSAYPCYLSFQRLSGKGGSPEGGPIRTATNERGWYHADIPEGFYQVSVFGSDGRERDVLRGEAFHQTGTKRFHNCKIDN